MDLLTMAVVDITTLVATCQALKSGPVGGGLALKRKLRDRLRRDIKRGTVAYIDVLARTRRGVVDAALLARCRVAAEQRMAHALMHQEQLARMMATEAGSLDGLVAARQDLWRLAHMVIHLASGMTGLGEPGALSHGQPADVLARRLRRRIRKALIAYARAALRDSGRPGHLIFAAREAALAEIGPRAVADARRLAAIEAGARPLQTVPRQGVSKSLDDLNLDWRRSESAPP